MDVQMILKNNIQEALEDKDVAYMAYCKAVDNLYQARKAYQDYFTPIDDDQEHENSRDNEDGLADKVEDDRQATELI